MRSFYLPSIHPLLRFTVTTDFSSLFVYIVSRLTVVRQYAKRLTDYQDRPYATSVNMGICKIREHLRTLPVSEVLLAVYRTR